MINCLIKLSKIGKGVNMDQETKTEQTWIKTQNAEGSEVDQYTYEELATDNKGDDNE